MHRRPERYAGVELKKEVIKMLEKLNLDIAERIDMQEFAKILGSSLYWHHARMPDTEERPFDKWQQKHKIEELELCHHEIIITQPEIADRRDSRFITPRQFQKLYIEGKIVPNETGFFAVRVWPEYAREESNNFTHMGYVNQANATYSGPERIYLRLYCAFKK